MSENTDPVALLALTLEGFGIAHVFRGSVAVAAQGGPALADTSLRVVLVAPSRFAVAQVLNRLQSAGARLEPTSALRSFDSKFGVLFDWPLDEGAGKTVSVELERPRLAPIAKALFERSKIFPRASLPAGLRVATLEDEVLARVLSFEEADRTIADSLLASTPALDVGYVAISLGLVYPPESDRAVWLAEAARRHGFVKDAR